MPQISTSIATSLNGSIATSLAGRGGAAGPLLTYSDLIFANASERYLVDPITPQVLGPFAANTLATATIGGKVFGQFEGARTNLITRSQDFSHADWGKSVCTVAPATDPLGGSTAWKVISNNGATGEIYQSPAFDNSSVYPLWFIAKAAEWDWCNIYSHDGNNHHNAWFDLTNGVPGTKLYFDATGMVDLGGGWWLCWAQMTRKNPGNLWYNLRPTNSDNPLDNGDGTSGVIFWNPDAELGPFPSSPIKTVAAAVTRAADVGYFASAVVPAAFKTAGFKFDLINEWEETEPAGDLVLFATDANNYLKWDNTAKTYALYIGGVKKMDSNALTLDRATQHTLEMNLVTGDTTVTGATTGDGTNAGTGTTVPAGNLYWGGDHAGANQYFGLIEEAQPL